MAPDFKISQELVTRIREELLKEASASLGTFEVQDLKTHVEGLGDHMKAAWEISYKTSSVSVALPGERVVERPGGERAWEISYKTSSRVGIETIREQAKGK